MFFQEIHPVLQEATPTIKKQNNVDQHETIKPKWLIPHLPTDRLRVSANTQMPLRPRHGNYKQHS